MKLGLKQKIILTILLISMLVSTLLAVMFYRSAVRIIENNYTSSATSSMNVCINTFDDMMRDVYLTAVDTSMNPEIVSLIGAGDEQSETELLERMENLRTGNIASIYCYIPSRNLLLRATQTGSTRAACDAEELAWINDVIKPQRNPFCPIYTEDKTSVVQEEIFQYVREVTAGGSEGTEDTDETVLGYLMFNVKERIVYFNCLQGNGHFSEGESYLTKNAYIVSCSNLKQLNRRLPSAVADSMLRIKVSASFTGYQMVMQIKRSAITDDIRRTRNEILLFALLLNLLASFPVLVIVRRMMNPMQELENAMKQVGQGDFAVRAPVHYKDEIGVLSAGFNDMLNQIEELIEELVTQKLLKKEAEIEALQYQITPHFMYNTLNSIKYAAVLQNCDSIANLLNAFIELLQITASDRGAFVTVDREMHMVEDYVMLQQFRYANSFEVVFDVDKDARPCYLPSLLIQPLVENAILHGIDLKKPGGCITIRALRLNDLLAIKVEDNGSGMSPEDIQQLMSGQRKSKFSGIGVRNIRERLQLYYGGQGSLKFFSEQGVGTSAVITLPVSYDPEEYTI